MILFVSALLEQHIFFTPEELNEDWGDGYNISDNVLIEMPDNTKKQVQTNELTIKFNIST